MKKILIIDDSTLMRRVLSDIINASEKYKVTYTALNGVEGLRAIEEEPDIDIIFLDIHMPQMNGIEFLEVLNKKHIIKDIFVFSSISTEDGEDTLRALELGAIDFIKKPTNILSNKDKFRTHIFRLLDGLEEKYEKGIVIPKAKPLTSRTKKTGGEGKVIALACSTGGPKALQSIIPCLPADLNSSVLIVQHMPEEFTKSLAARLNELSKLHVKEAEDGEYVQKGTVYIAPGGKHMLVSYQGGRHHIVLNEDEPVIGLRPYANYMYNSLVQSNYEEITCVVLTGMGSDGTEGIKRLNSSKNIYVIAQDATTSTVYGMPRSIAETGLVDEVHKLSDISEAIIKRVGVK